MTMFNLHAASQLSNPVNLESVPDNGKYPRPRLASTPTEQNEVIGIFSHRRRQRKTCSILNIPKKMNQENVERCRTR